MFLACEMIYDDLMRHTHAHSLQILLHFLSMHFFLLYPRYCCYYHFFVAISFNVCDFYLLCCFLIRSNFIFFGGGIVGCSKQLALNVISCRI